MKKSTIWVLMLTMLTALLSGCAASAGDLDTTAAEVTEQTQALTETVKDKLDEVKAKGVLVLGTSADYPPYEFHMEIDGKDTIVGFDIEIAKKLAAAMGVELEIIDMKFEGLLPALTAGKIDLIIAGMTPTEERKTSVDFSIVYYDAKQTMLVLTENGETLNSVEAFDGKTVGVQKASIQEALAIETFKTSTVKAIDKIPNLIMELKTGKVHGLVMAEPVAKQYDQANDDVAINGIDLGSEGGSAIAVQKNSGAFLTLIDETLNDMLESGEMDQIIAEAMLLSEGE